MTDAFVDVITANEHYAESYGGADLIAPAARGLGVVTCMDSRIDPLAVLGLQPGDAKVLRNAGGRVTDEVRDTLGLASYLLNVRRIMVIAHTACAMASNTTDQLHEKVAAAGGPDTRSLAFRTTGDQQASVREDVQRLRSWPYLEDVPVAGFILDLQTGLLHQVC